MPGTYTIAGNFVSKLNESKEAMEELKKFSSATIVFELDDDEPFTLFIKNGRAKVKRGAPEPPDPDAMRILTGQECIANLVLGKSRFTDVYTAELETEPAKIRKMLYFYPSLKLAGGMVGGPFVWRFGKLIRIGQDIR